MIKIALTNLESYNEGELVYEWVDLPCEDFTDAFAAIGNPEEYFISDYECEIPHMIVREYENLEQLNEIAEELECLTPYQIRVLTAIMENDGADIDYALLTLDEERYYYYETDDFDDFIDVAIDDGLFGEVPQTIKRFLDYDELRNYFENNGYQLTSTGIINTY